jgi:nucleotidyltransferase substrate binding protein (TIGR01987 family)
MTRENSDIRWEQRFSNFRKALSQLKKFIQKGELSDLEEQGLIKAFEYTYELAWNTLKDYLEYQGNTNITGARDTFREAFQAGLISDGEAWMDMLASRNKTSHTYNEDTAKEIAGSIFQTYYKLYVDLEAKMESLQLGSQSEIFSKE